MSMKRSKQKAEAAQARMESDRSPERAGDSKDETVEARVLIENHQVGCLIGKAGANVKRVREESGAFVSILKAEFRNVQERVMVIKGANSQIAKASHLIAQLLLDAQTSREKKKSAEPASVQIRLLVHKAAVGAIIGQRGATIKETQSQTSTRIQISNDPLPGSTEKSVTISGAPEAIHKAVSRVLTQLASNPIKPSGRVMPYVPGQPSFSAPFAVPPGPFGPALVYSPLHPAYLGAASATSTQKIAIPTICAGCIIGKGGSVIRDLRSQSGTNISIADSEPTNPHERVVTLTGTPQGIQTAVYLIRQLVEQYQPPAGASYQ